MKIEYEKNKKSQHSSNHKISSNDNYIQTKANTRKANGMFIKRMLRSRPVLAGLAKSIATMVAITVTISLAQAEFPSAKLTAVESSTTILPGDKVVALAIKPDPVAVNGTLILANKTPSNENPKSALNEIRLPEATVYLIDDINNVVDKGLTQLDGKFDLTVPGKGKYQLCWSVNNLTKGCKRPFIVGSKTVYLQRVIVTADTDSYVYGHSLLKVDRPCWLHEPFFKVNLFTAIDLVDSANNVVRGSTVKANVAGEYVIGLPGKDRYRIRSSCEKTVYETKQLYSAGIYNASLPLNNFAPRSIALSGYNLGGKGIVRADPGAFITSKLTAGDNDHDPLTFEWKVLDGSGNVTNIDSDKQDWTLPFNAGLHQVYAMAKDGKGGYAIDRLDMSVGPPVVNFSGLVIDEVTRLPVANARVDVTGVQAKTNAQGWFKLTVPELSGDQRYTLNINHFSYATYSRVLDKSSRGNTFRLIQAQVTYHDPKGPIDVVDVSSSGPCGIGDPRRAEQTGKPTNEQKIDRTQVKPDCERRGARLILPANSLVYADQSPANGPVSLSMATLNPARRTLPGDYRAIDRNGDAMELVSFGALFATFHDVFGKEVNLRNGMQALLDVPISNNQLAVANNDIPMWTYEEKTGFWLEEDKASKQLTPDGFVYRGKTRHFSTINMDVAGNDPNFATCVRLEVGASLSSWSSLILRAYVTEGGSTSPQVKETALDGAQYHAIYRIPYSNPPAGNTLRLELRGELPSGNDVVLLDNIINTDARPKMTGTDLWPDFPYDECGEPIVLEADPVDLPYYGDIDATGRPAFLTGPYGQYLPEDPVQSSNDYYDAVDTGNNKLTLGDWWGANGFDPSNGLGGTRASYLNHNDLGFGRDMHCLGNSSDYACYVTNYGLPDQNPANADDALSQEELTQGATVTMEYHAAAGNNAVSFYAYGGGVSSSARINFADLDGLGPKPIPHLCMICHGSDGAVLDGNNLVPGAKFREFDLPSFRYSDNRSWVYGQAPDAAGITTLSPGEFTAFHTLNNEIAAINSSNKIADLINAWYPGVSDVPVQPAPPSNWTAGAPSPAETLLYDEVYGTACRTCHIARGFPETHSQLTSSEYAVCNQPKIMPNAFITYKNFWSDPFRVGIFEDAISNLSCEQ